MTPTATGTLAKWGNSQGVRIPKDICELIGIQVGSAVSIRADQAKSEVVLTFEKPDDGYRRSRKVSMEELCAGWSGERVGEEWGGPDVGAEVVD
ncbi:MULTISPECIES: AbrB/MazE/SpoVT family DNA-binding domain-containing protein [unclassified Adlercreutzia]|uniref:AbrB/MazE/SpoVT family DNA-binding domain-containing protein n=1 Tax=unclassified Adlercreutzia TaxID=2636013 RepID=UPI0013EA9CB9|nr:MULTISPECIES: AbrB/MazE/SpoVT family DNA-binding domain-containing protein [unclassified Adlercreutzia]